MKKILLCFVAAILLTACKVSDSNKDFEVNGLYSISVPSFMNKTTDLNDEASFQYQNIWKELYAMVIEESKEGFGEALQYNEDWMEKENSLSTYTQIVYDNIAAVAEVYEKEWKETVIHGLPAKILQLNANIGGLDIFYMIGIVDGKENYYQVYTWTLSKKEAEHQEKMQAIIDSFQEL